MTDFSGRGRRPGGGGAIVWWLLALLAVMAVIAFAFALGGGSGT